MCRGCGAVAVRHVRSHALFPVRFLSVSVLADISDHTNQSIAFSGLSVAWGARQAPLQRPAAHCPIPGRAVWFISCLLQRLHSIDQPRDLSQVSARCWARPSVASSRGHAVKRGCWARLPAAAPRAASSPASHMCWRARPGRPSSALQVRRGCRYRCPGLFVRTVPCADVLPDLDAVDDSAQRTEKLLSSPPTRLPSSAALSIMMEETMPNAQHNALSPWRLFRRLRRVRDSFHSSGEASICKRE